MDFFKKDALPNLTLHFLDLVGKVKVWLIKMMYTDIPVFSTRGVANPLWVDSNLEEKR